MPDFKPELLSYDPDFDGGRWVANSSENEWIIIKFPYQVEIAAIKTRIMADSGGFKNFALQYYTPEKGESSLWSDIYTGVGPDEDYWVEYKFPLLKASRLRVYVYDSYGPSTSKISIMGLKLGFTEGKVYLVLRSFPKIYQILCNILITEITENPKTSEPGDLDLGREYWTWMLKMTSDNDVSMNFLNTMKFLWVSSMYYPQYYQPKHNLGTFLHYLLVYVSKNGDAKVRCFR